jgi:hypothetical protein
MNKA